MSQAFYGGYAHDANSVWFPQYSREYVDGPTGYHKVLRVTIDLEAKIIRGSQFANFAELENMKAAYSVDGQDFAFVDPQGDFLSWNLDSSTAAGGVRVLKPVTHQDIKGSHGVNWIKARVTLVADYVQTLQPYQYISFREIVTFTGRGQPNKVERTPANVPPFKQVTSYGSWYRAVQEGEATSTDQNLIAMAPLAPDLFEGHEGDALVTPAYAIEVTRGSPVLWGRRWAYRFSDSNPIVIRPNVY